MGRTYRQKDKRFKKQLKEIRRVRKNKRSSWDDEYSNRKTEDRKKQDTVGSYIFI